MPVNWGITPWVKYGHQPVSVRVAYRHLPYFAPTKQRRGSRYQPPDRNNFVVDLFGLLAGFGRVLIINLHAGNKGFGSDLEGSRNLE